MRCGSVFHGRCCILHGLSHRFRVFGRSARIGVLCISVQCTGRGRVLHVPGRFQLLTSFHACRVYERFVRRSRSGCVHAVCCRFHMRERYCSGRMHYRHVQFDASTDCMFDVSGRLLLQYNTRNTVRCGSILCRRRNGLYELYGRFIFCGLCGVVQCVPHRHVFQ